MTRKNEIAQAPQIYTVIAGNLEPPRSAEFTIEPGPVEAGRLAIIRIGKLETIGRYYPDVEGADWIVQPGLLIRVTGSTPVRVVGPVVSLVPINTERIYA